jgi:Alw26I/Eco31I/Esp3I family type II restriction endonuclease
MTHALPNIDADPKSYGSKGQSWNSTFVEYMKAIVEHPNYAGMPDAVKPDGKIQWEAPSNRGGGLYKDTHHKRRDWWRTKAAAIGLSGQEDKWISRVAKTIHPTGEKPCKRCGQVLRIAYVYPSGMLVSRARKAFGAGLEPDALEEIGDYIRRLVDVQGALALRLLPSLLRTKTINPPDLGEDLVAWLAWLDDNYIPLEPAMLSPGVMSNAPDRFDGFHSFNRCCRGEADTGRHTANMRTYSTDRRVFEYWSEGNWIAADRMMGLVRAKFVDHPTADGGDGPPTADHIGPLSLGFSHRPEFRLLSRSANSAKNNRMTLWDVQHLIERETAGVSVVSWYAHPVWDLLKCRVSTEETALRLSKVMRDNQRIAMGFLARFQKDGHATFLAALLELDFADYEVEFEKLEIVNFVTVYDALVCTNRTTKYAVEQKSRRTRIGFEALRAYAAKPNRHCITVSDARVECALHEAECVLLSARPEIQALNVELLGLLAEPGTKINEDKMREVCEKLPALSAEPYFVEARRHLQQAMDSVGEILADLWEDERYVRAEFPLDDE